MTRQGGKDRGRRAHLLGMNAHHRVDEQELSGVELFVSQAHQASVVGLRPGSLGWDYLCIDSPKAGLFHSAQGWLHEVGALHSMDLSATAV